MADFDKAIDLILKQEGGYVDSRNDRGGSTNYGISLVFLKSLGELYDLDNNGDIDKIDISLLTPALAKDIYKKYFWDKCHLDDINNQQLAEALFSTAVNCGCRTAIKIAQRSYNEVSDSRLIVDGFIGKNTIDAFNEVTNLDIPFLEFFVINLINYYREIVNIDRDQYSNLLGWINRAFDLLN